MLILSRRLNEAIRIGDEVTVTVLGVQGTHVRLGFTAPRDVPVNREEVYLRTRGDSANSTETGTIGNLALKTSAH